jgi:hypothetical protein
VLGQTTSRDEARPKRHQCSLVQQILEYRGKLNFNSILEISGYDQGRLIQALSKNRTQNYKRCFEVLNCRCSALNLKGGQSDPAAVQPVACDLVSSSYDPQIDISIKMGRSHLSCTSSDVLF